MLDINQPEQALRLARENLSRRTDIGSGILFARRADASGDHAAACKANAQARAFGFNPPELAELNEPARRCAAAP